MYTYIFFINGKPKNKKKKRGKRKKDKKKTNGEVELGNREYETPVTATRKYIQGSLALCRQIRKGYNNFFIFPFSFIFSRTYVRTQGVPKITY